MRTHPLSSLICFDFSNWYRSTWWALDIVWARRVLTTELLQVRELISPHRHQFCWIIFKICNISLSFSVLFCFRCINFACMRHCSKVLGDHDRAFVERVSNLQEISHSHLPQVCHQLDALSNGSHGSRGHPHYDAKTEYICAAPYVIQVMLFSFYRLADASSIGQQKHSTSVGQHSTRMMSIWVRTKFWGWCYYPTGLSSKSADKMRNSNAGVAKLSPSMPYYRYFFFSRSYWSCWAKKSPKTLSRIYSTLVSPRALQTTRFKLNAKFPDRSP